MHRVLYEEAFGPVGDLLVRHTCDNRMCINLNHLIPGTVKENAIDRKMRGRNNTARGESRSDTKLTDEQVRHIRATSGLISQGNLARRYGVSQSTISRIRSGERRIHVA